MFSAADRQIFVATIGPHQVQADPDPMLRRFRKALQGHDLGILYARASGQRHAKDLDQGPVPDDECDAAAEQLVGIAQSTLGVTSYDRDPGKGWTEGELLAGLSAFLEFITAKKEPGASLPNS